MTLHHRTMDRVIPYDCILTNLQAVLPDYVLNPGVLAIQNGCLKRISQEFTPSERAAALESGTNILDFGGDILIPGLLDLHVHGCGGADTMDDGAEAFSTMASALLRQGTTAFLATTMTGPLSRLQKVLKKGNDFCSADDQAEFLGFHLEGPCISPKFCGAQKLPIMSEQSVPFTGMVRIVTLAPEISAAKKIMNDAQKNGILISVGHSGASYEEMLLAINEGASYVTHAFNAMPGIHHRDPGLLTAALLDSRVTVELIADGIHVHPAVLEMAVRLKGAEGVVLVSDGTRAIGMPDGEYELGGQQAWLRDGRMTLTNGTIAGSASPLLAGVKFMKEVVGRPLYEAVRMATLTPARLMHIENRMGLLKEGNEATFLRLSPQLELKEVWVRGRKQYSAMVPLESVENHV